MSLCLDISSVSSRTATILVRPIGAKYHLDEAYGWTLTDGNTKVKSDTTNTVPVFIEGLEPATRYSFSVDGQSVDFETSECAGLINALDHGVDEEALDNSQNLQAAIDATPKGGTLLLPAGTYRTRPIFLKADMTLYLSQGSCLYADHNRRGWPILDPRDTAGRVIGTWEGLPEASFAAPVTAIDCDNLVITGLGCIDAGGDRGDWWQWPKEKRDGARRPRALFLAHGRNVQLSGFKVMNSPSWTVHPFHVHNLNCSALSIENPADSPNTDGLNPESCTDVKLVGIRFTVGDDCIAVKAGKRAPGQVDHIAPTRRLLVQNCLMERGHGGVVLGSEMSGEITDVTVKDCIFVGTDRGLRVKTRRGRGGKVSGVFFSDVIMKDVLTPFAINAFYFCDPDGHDDWVQNRAKALVDETTPEIHDIRLERITATGVSIAGVAVLGLPESPVRDVSISEFKISFDTSANAGVPLMADGVQAVRNVPIWSEFAEVDGSVHLLENT